MNQFRNFDTRRPDGAYLQFERLEVPDDCTRLNDAECYDTDQIAAFNRGEWRFVGIVARAHIWIIRSGHGTHYCVDSAGLWGIESTSGEYLTEVFAAQCDELRADLALFGALQIKE